ncbi:hypothetical protein GTP46_05960 [Duganella sp. FT135W]|uniref:Uncharacterized protein n=1 Tax=Duganella flavida TaxID=2692175 RepID=A0A6L8K8K1_9BURK|nr:hypothetical protein [Duganella flavida]MYM22184.1 hypothetical protein [Duganella flavida]
MAFDIMETVNNTESSAVQKFSFCTNENISIDEFKKKRLKSEELLLTGVSKYCQKEYGWSDEKTQVIESQYRDFLSLYAVDFYGQFVATKDVDLYWHIHILHTRLYKHHCEIMYSRFLDHDPVAGNEDLTPYRSAYKQTLAALERVGSYPSDIGLSSAIAEPKPAACMNSAPKPAACMNAAPAPAACMNAAPKPAACMNAVPKPAACMNASPAPAACMNAAPKPAACMNAVPKPAACMNASPAPAACMNAAPKPAACMNAAPKPAACMNAAPKPAACMNAAPKPAACMNAAPRA